MEMIFILMKIKLIFTKKVVHLASFCKWGFLELGSGHANAVSNSFPHPVIEGNARWVYSPRIGMGILCGTRWTYLPNCSFLMQVDSMWVFSLSSWPVWTALTGMTFVKKITSQFIQQLRCSGESYFKNELKSLNLKYISYSVKTFGGSFLLKKWLKITTNKSDFQFLTRITARVSVWLRWGYSSFRLGVYMQIFVSFRVFRTDSRYFLPMQISLNGLCGEW